MHRPDADVGAGIVTLVLSVLSKRVPVQDLTALECGRLVFRQLGDLDDFRP